MSDEDYSPPKGSKADAAHLAARVGLSALAGPAAELFSALVTPPLERRRNEWMEEVGTTLRRLEQDRGLKLEELQEDPAFIDTVMQASQAALRTSQEEKRQALRNAILNSALAESPDRALQQTFVTLADVFTEWHLRVLSLFDEPARWFDEHGQAAPRLSMGGLSAILCSAYPELREKRQFYDLVWSELYARGLVNLQGLHVTMTGTGLFESRTTQIGKEFLRFITAPFA